nr:hypothetical protein [Sandaracinus sp.]
MAFKLVENVMLLVHTNRPPSDEEWGEYVEAVDAQGAAPLAQLVHTQGGSPNAKQRGAFTKMLAGRTVPVAVLNDSALVRGAVTAIAWFNPSLRAFKSADIDAALQYLGVPESRWSTLKNDLEDLRASVQRSAT